MKIKFEPADIKDLLSQSYYEYATAVYPRAIPSIDGFTEASRRLLYMAFLKNYYSYVKCAKLTGETMGNLHPHGSSYETIVEFSTPFKGIHFFDFHGNMGPYGPHPYKLQDDPPAAERYTECKLNENSRILFDDWVPTLARRKSYDGKMMEPELLPVSLPVILLRRHTGIGVAYASTFQPYTLNDVKRLIGLWREGITKEEYTEDVVREGIFPTMPSGGIHIFDDDKMRTAYNTGRGTFTVGAKYRILKEGHTFIIEITELPPDMTPSSLLSLISTIHRKDSKSRVSRVDDLTRDTPLVEVSFKRGTKLEQVKEFLGKLKLEKSVSINMTLLINGIPKCCSLYEVITEWINFREGCIKERHSWELSKLKELIDRKGILLRAANKLVEVAEILRGGDEKELIQLGFKEGEIPVVLSFTLNQLKKLEVGKIREEISKAEAEVSRIQGVNIRGEILGIGKKRSVSWKNKWRDYVRERLSKVPRNYSKYLGKYEEEPKDIKSRTDKFIEKYLG